jgi:UDP-N-acetylmuramoyl-tripeptide--D-alanyl-D-alanine ligase
MLFVALTGERFDGHDYVGDAFRKGARAALVSRVVDASGPLLVVEDTRLALQGLARAIVRKRFGEGKKLVTLTGTAGKTTTRELVRLVLSGKNARSHSNRENWNNEIGVPRTLWEWGENDGDAVLEVGIRNPGDMDYLSSVLLSDAAIVTSVGEGHLETLGSVEGVWNEKSRLLDWVRPGGGIVLPLDLLRRYPASPIFRDPGKKFFFVELHPQDGATNRSPLPLPPRSTILSGSIRKGPDGEWILSSSGEPGIFSWKMPSPSTLLATDALLALAAGLSLGVPLPEGARRLEGFQSLPGRMQEKRSPEGALVLLDHYNANPLSLRGGFQWCVDVWNRERALTGGGQQGKLLAILGDMLELGPDAPRLHREVGKMAAECPFSAIFYRGRFFEQFQEGHRAGGGDPGVLVRLPETAPPVRDAFPALSRGDVVLVKGSRGMHLEREACLLGVEA